MKYFITGATGFIGGRIAHLLLESGHELVVLARNSERAKSLITQGATVIEGDITRKESMREGMEGVDGVFHIAAVYKFGFRNNAMMERINIDGTRNVLKLMKELNIQKGVYTSTVGVYSDTKGQIVDESYCYKGKPLSEYERTKWIAHYEIARVMQDEGLPLVIVLPGLVYGPGDTSSVGEMLSQYINKKLYMIPKTGAFCWGHVDDIAQGHILAMEKGKPGEEYIIAGPPHDIDEAFSIMEKLTGIKAPKIRMPSWSLKGLSVIMSGLEKVFPISPTYSSEGLKNTAGVTFLASNEKAKQELGYQVRGLEDGLNETLAALMKP